MKSPKGGMKLIDVNVLRGKIVERGKSQADVVKAIGITPKTFYDKMNRAVFGSDEIEIMIDFNLSIKSRSIFNGY